MLQGVCSGMQILHIVKEEKEYVICSIPKMYYLPEGKKVAG